MVLVTARIVTTTGLGMVLVAAAVLSFHALDGLAVAVSIPPSLSWLLPIAVDAGAAVSCGCWLSRWVNPDASRFARGMTWSLLGLTVVANAGQLGMHAAGINPPWWVAVLVGAIPPAVVGGTVHLAVLVGRGVPTTDPLDEADDQAEPDESPAGDDRVAELIADGVGRRRLSKELDITEHQARELLAARRNGAAL